MNSDLFRTLSRCSRSKLTRQFKKATFFHQQQEFRVMSTELDFKDTCTNENRRPFHGRTFYPTTVLVTLHSASTGHTAGFPRPVLKSLGGSLEGHARGFFKVHEL